MSDNDDIKGSLPGRMTAEAWFVKKVLRLLMRELAVAILVIGTVAMEPAVAQRYDPAYPVCLHVYALGANYYECRYTSLPQCNAAASGRAALCEINPYFAGAEEPEGYSRHRRVR